MNNFKELINKANKKSIEDFYRFITNMYGIDNSLFEHIEKIPIIAPYEGDKLTTIPLSYKTEDDLLEIVDDFIAYELGDHDGCFISLDKMACDFYSDEDFEEWRKNLNPNTIKGNTELQLQEKFDEFIRENIGKWIQNLGYNAIIVYNESKLQKDYKDLIHTNITYNKNKTNEELEQIFVDYVKHMFTHERCHMNANYFVSEIHNKKYYSEELNGAEISSWEEDNILKNSNSELENGKFIVNDYHSERNEVLIDTLAGIIDSYQIGDSVEDCIYKIIEKRDR